MKASRLSRRDFLKTAGLALGGLALARPLARLERGVFLPGEPSGSALTGLPQQPFPEAERLGRVFGGQVKLKARPDIDSEDVGILNEDEIVVWERELVGKRPMWQTQRFVETPNGYVYAPNLQPVRNLPNSPLQALPGGQGMWVEVTVPYVDLQQANPPARSPWLKHGGKARLYYSQVMWVDDLRVDDGGQVWYHVGERYGTFGDIFWAPAEALRPITAEEMAPISPGVEDKRVEVNLLDQTLSCYEGQAEVYFCRVSTGGKYDADGNASDKWSTPVGSHTIWRKLVSVHMTGGTAGGGYDLPGIGWTTLFSGNGVAVHATFWHNSYGIPTSHGCVNCRPEDAKFIFRWTNPGVDYEPGDVTISGTKGSSKVVVVERQG